MLKPAVLAIAFLTLLLAGCKGGNTVVNAGPTAQTGITVSGTGRAFGAPDVVNLQLGVQTEARTVADAREQAASAAQAVIDSVKKDGVDDKDVRTTQFSIQPQYDTGRTTIRAYRVSNTLSVKVRKLDSASKVIDDVAAAGKDNTVVQSISFSIDDPSQLQALARADAMKQVQAKASQLSKLGGVSLGKTVSISEGGGGPQPLAAPAVLAPARTGDTSTPIESGQLEVTVTLNVTYAIE